MTLQDIIRDLEAVQKAVALITGAITALKEKYEPADNGGFYTTVNPSEFSEDYKTPDNSVVKIKSAVIKENDKMFQVRDGKLRFKNGYYEYSFRRFGYNRYFTGKTLAIAEKKFRAFLRELNQTIDKKTVLKKARLPFEEWAKTYLEKFRKFQVTEQTYKNIEGLVRRHLLPKFARRSVETITAMEVQDVINGLLSEGKGKTAEDVKTFLKGFFKTALTHGHVRADIMDGVVVPKHYRKKGSALTLAEERELLEGIKGSYYETAIKVLLYSGMRVSELTLLKEADIDFEHNTIAITTTKQKDRVNVVKRIVPIFPKLLPVLRDATKASPLKVNAKHISYHFKKVMPNHHLHELRHTFTTRCRECGIDNELTSLWTGHTFAGNTTALVYTHFSMEFQQKKAKLVDY